MERATKRPGVPWWYQYVRSWQVRMWIETGVRAQPVPAADPERPPRRPTVAG